MDLTGVVVKRLATPTVAATFAAGQTIFAADDPSGASGWLGLPKQ